MGVVRSSAVLTTFCSTHGEIMTGLSRWLSLLAVAVVVGLGLGLAGGWTVNGWRMGSEIDRLKAQHSKESEQALAQVLDETERMQRAKDQAIADAQEQVRRNAAAAAAARSERERLRQQLEANRSALAGAAPAAVAAYASTLTNVFEQCVREYQDVAAKADGHASDASVLFDTWKALATPRASKP